MGNYKDKNGTSFVGDLLRKGKEIGLDIAPEILNVAGSLTGFGGLKELGNLLDNDPKVSEEQAETILEMAALHVSNTQGAREMQISALSQGDNFSKRFIYYLAIFWSLTAVAYIFFATFCEVENPHVLDIVLGFLLGTIVATIINFFFGSSGGSKEKTKGLLSAVKSNI